MHNPSEPNRMKNDELPLHPRLTALMHRRHPDWVMLSSPYRPQVFLPTFHEVELGRYFFKELHS